MATLSAKGQTTSHTVTADNEQVRAFAEGRVKIEMQPNGSSIYYPILRDAKEQMPYVITQTVTGDIVRITHADPDFGSMEAEFA